MFSVNALWIVTTLALFCFSLLMDFRVFLFDQGWAFESIYASLAFDIPLSFCVIVTVLRLRRFVKGERSQREAWLMTLMAAACIYALVFAFTRYGPWPLRHMPDWPADSPGWMGQPPGFLSLLVVIVAFLFFSLPWFRSARSTIGNVVRLLPLGAAWFLYYSILFIGLLGPMAGIFYVGGYTYYLLERFIPSWLWVDRGWDAIDSPFHIPGYLLLVIGMAIVIVGFAQVVGVGKKRLVTGGLYATVRHPQNLGIAIGTFGATVLFSLYNTPGSFIAWFTIVYLFVAFAVYEEDGLARQFGEEYLVYRRRTPFIVPFLRTGFHVPGGWKRLVALLLLYPAGAGLIYWILWVIHPGPVG
ncbi:MAG: hypothetical protein ISS53_02050 [Dehalococcoidia bacterium]|nr:hypothetical protein [Dehalococcoidia bacterium]